MAKILQLLTTFYNWLFNKNKQDNKEIKKESSYTELWTEKFTFLPPSGINPLEVNSFTKDKFDRFRNKIKLGDLMLLKDANLLYRKPIIQDVYFIVNEEHMMRSDHYIHKGFYSNTTDFGIDIINYNMTLYRSEIVEKIDLNYYIQKEKLQRNE